MGSKKNVDMTTTNDTVKVVAAVEPVTETENEVLETESEKVTAKTTKSKGRGKKYQAVRSKIDKTKLYDAFSAVELVKKLSYSKFDGTITAHLILKETGASASVTFPHSTGKSIKVAIASDEVLKQIEAGQLDFDVLVASPAFMPKLTKFARVLGPKGLMPNPKTGTLTSNPEEKKKQLEAGEITVRTEKKAPLIHITVGKVSHETKDLVENIQEVMKAFKGKLVKLSIAATMSPAVKVAIE